LSRIGRLTGMIRSISGKKNDYSICWIVYLNLLLWGIPNSLLGRTLIWSKYDWKEEEPSSKNSKMLTIVSIVNLYYTYIKSFRWRRLAASLFFARELGASIFLAARKCMVTPRQCQQWCSWSADTPPKTTALHDYIFITICLIKYHFLPLTLFNNLKNSSLSSSSPDYCSFSLEFYCLFCWPPSTCYIPAGLLY
jgi:hypothetical protein